MEKQTSIGSENVNHEFVSVKTYIDQRLIDLEKIINVNLALDRKAVDQYSKTNDEWKGLHNDMQRKREIENDTYLKVERYEFNHRTLNEKVDTNQRLISEKIESIFKSINEKIEANQKFLTEKMEALIKSLDEKIISNLKTESEKHGSTDNQMRLLIDNNADKSDTGLKTLNTWKDNTQGSVKVILAVGSFLIAIVIGLIIAVIHNWKS